VYGKNQLQKELPFEASFAEVAEKKKKLSFRT